MYTYTIKKNGYPLCQAIGKNRAIKNIMLCAGQGGKWKGMEYIKGNDVYTIERE